MTEAIPAATLVLFRESGEGTAEHLFVERSATMRFAAGAIVFPGGRVEQGDRRLAETFPAYELDDAAARICAIRESIEEGGIGAGLSPPPDLAVTERLRFGLEAGTIFADLLAAEQLSLDLDALVPFARWQPNFPESRVFDTRFYIARVDASAPAARVDETENVRVFWATAAEVLDQADAGQVTIIYPTRRNLERLAALGTFEQTRLQLDVLPSPPPMITPFIQKYRGKEFLCIPEGMGYPVMEQAMSEVRRG